MESSDNLDVVILGEGTAREFFGNIDIVGKRFELGGQSNTVVGVVEDVSIWGLSAGDSRQLYIPLAPMYGSFSTFLLQMSNPDLAEGLFPAIREVGRSVAPNASIEEVSTLARQLSGTLAREQFLTTLLATFAFLALSLAGVGLYGVVSQVVGQQTRDIGIRIALGATRSRVSMMVLRGGATATCVGIVTGALLAVGGLDLLSSKLFGAEQGSPGVYLAAGLVTILATLLAVWAPTRRAMRIHPMTAMRGN